MSNAIIAKVRSILVEYASLGSEAIMSGAWAYPFLGISYVATHPNISKSILPIVSKTIMTSLGITGGLFFFTYIPQLAICALFSGPLAFIPATVLVLLESYLLVSFVTKTFFLSSGQDLLFDAVLLQQGNEQLVQNGREIQSSSNGIKTLGKPLSGLPSQLSKDRLVRYLISLPLNSIPIIGTVSFLIYNGSKLGPSFHSRYFQLKKYNKSQVSEFVQKRKGAYTAFGISSLVLNLVPVAGFAFSLTSTVGAALWASRLEKLKIDANDNVDYRLENDQGAAEINNQVPVELETLKS
ncbi:hypothetical protein FA15DRAFT_668903 [Coprinopsis marcescibilis]|uniref:Outer spore wall protein RRT8 n=1 Tax=Coprinopsis marcescibilis TaxID=230819 RepID=A0A5C3L9V4_COPMA|nr:hypothetical protein FA15DRAFT_668903 [Coprinopsis marcescibilis]